MKITDNLESIIIGAQKAGLLAGINKRPGSNHRVHQSLGSRAVPIKPFVIDGKKMSWGQAKQYLKARGV